MISDLVTPKSSSKQANLQLELEITNKNLQLVTATEIKEPAEQRPTQPILLPALDTFQVPTLSELRESKKLTQDKWLPHNNILTTKGVLEYKDIELSEFILGFLEMIRDLSPADTQPLLNYLSLLMEKAGSYTWPSIRNFHLSHS